MLKFLLSFLFLVSVNAQSNNNATLCYVTCSLDGVNNGNPFIAGKTPVCQEGTLQCKLDTTVCSLYVTPGSGLPGGAGVGANFQSMDSCNQTLTAVLKQYTVIPLPNVTTTTSTATSTVVPTPTRTSDVGKLFVGILCLLVFLL